MIAGARSPAIAVAIYLTVVAIALAIGLSGTCCGEQGIWAMVLTLPWSIVAVFVLDAIDPELIGRMGAVATVPGALVNAAILYAALRSWTRRVGGPRADVPTEPAA